MNRILVNGQPAEQLSAYDRAVQYGDGLFETIAMYAGEPQHWQQHMHRLNEGCQRLHIPAPDSDSLRQQALSLS
ncbi:MAG: aminotransferase class IV, partial [Gammaproteobacteria bacterium]|nr:aminotransferase class IV [Gammaproteobacteria bacterium]